MTLFNCSRIYKSTSLLIFLNFALIHVQYIPGADFDETDNIADETFAEGNSDEPSDLKDSPVVFCDVFPNLRGDLRKPAPEPAARTTRSPGDLRAIVDDLRGEQFLLDDNGEHSDIVWGDWCKTTSEQAADGVDCIGSWKEHSSPYSEQVHIAY